MIVFLMISFMWPLERRCCISIGEGAHIGIGSSIIRGNHRKMGNDRCGCSHHVPDFAVIVGNPGRILKYNSQENE
jgi:acetyltransferase EpsM